MKKQNWIIAIAAGAGAAAVAYKLLSKDIPKGGHPVQPFDMNRYLGLWHEIARLPNRIEKNLEQLTEEYLDNGDGTYKVLTKAINTKTGELKELAGKIKFTDDTKTGMLKVSYFGPAYLNYNVLDIDADYRYALVSGSGLGYLWILSRETKIPGPIKAQFLKTAKEIGFDINKLEWMKPAKEATEK